MGKAGTILAFVCVLFLSTWRTLSPDAFLPGFGTHANTQNLPHFVLSLLVPRSILPRNAYFSLANAKLPNHPGLALLRVRGGVFFVGNATTINF